MGETPIPALTAAVMLAVAVAGSGCVQGTGSAIQLPGSLVQIPAGSRSGSGAQNFMTNLTSSAEKLGVSEQDLTNALNSTFQGEVNLTTAAKELGVSEQDLTNALNSTFQGEVNLTDEAQQMEITSRELASTLGIDLNASTAQGA